MTLLNQAAGFPEASRTRFARLLILLSILGSSGWAQAQLTKETIASSGYLPLSGPVGLRAPHPPTASATADKDERSPTIPSATRGYTVGESPNNELLEEASRMPGAPSNTWTSPENISAKMLVRFFEKAPSSNQGTDGTVRFVPPVKADVVIPASRGSN